MKNSSHTEPQEETSHGSVRSYALGFVLSIMVTLIPYYALTHGIVTPGIFLMIAVGAAVIQLFVQLILFLHLSFKKSSAVNTILVAYTGVMVLTIVIGTLWVMYHLKHNMHQDDSVYKNHTYTPQAQQY
jgi:cytochrome o ubiquinol oxidase operon protein cyoD